LSVLVLATAVVLAAACTQTTSAPTASNVAPTSQAASPTKAATAPPTQAPQTTVKSVSFPEKGHAITLIVPWAAGSPNDLFARLLSSYLERVLGTPVQVVDKPGASTQVGTAEFVKAKPDGYTLLVNAMTATNIVYLDPERKAGYSRKDFAPIALTSVEPGVTAVKGSSPYKTVKDLVDAAKASPGTIKVGDNGILTITHMSTLLLQKAAGVKFASVHFNGSSENITALLGDHIDVSSVVPSAVVAQSKTGEIRTLAVADTEESPVLPGVKTFKAQGYDVVIGLTRGLAAPAGTPQEVITVLESAVKKVLDDPDFQKKADEAGFVLRFMNAKDYAAHWDELDVKTAEIMKIAAEEEARK